MNDKIISKRMGKLKSTLKLINVCEIMVSNDIEGGLIIYELANIFTYEFNTDHRLYDSKECIEYVKRAANKMGFRNIIFNYLEH